MQLQRQKTQQLNQRRIPQKRTSSNFLLYIAVFIFVTFSVHAQSAVNLGDAANFSIVAQTLISDADPSVSIIVGNIGIDPAAGSFITDVSCTKVNGTIYDNNAGYTGGYDSNVTCLVTNASYVLDVQSDMVTAYNDARGRTGTNTTEFNAGDLGGQTLTPGLYKWSTAVTIPTDVTFDCLGDASGVFILQISQTLSISNGKQVILSGGCQAANIFWQLDTQATLGTTSIFNGNILAGTAIVINTGATLNGRAFAQTAVTLDANNVTLPAALSDVVAPVITLNTQNNSWTTNNQTELNFTFVDANSSTASCSLFINGTGYNSSFTVNNNSSTIITPNVTLDEGTYTWYVNCTDLSGNIGTSTPRLFSIDKTASNITLFTLSSSSVFVAETITGTCNATDNLDSNVTITITGIDTTTAGEKTATCTVLDAAGNNATSSAAYSVNAVAAVVLSSNGGGGSGSVGVIQWKCTDWSVCNSEGTRTQTCTRSNGEIVSNSKESCTPVQVFVPQQNLTPPLDQQPAYRVENMAEGTDQNNDDALIAEQSPQPINEGAKMSVWERFVDWFLRLFGKK